MIDRISKGLYWDRAWSLVEGCTPVSEGCDHCWSATQTHMRARNPNAKTSSRYSDLTDSKGRFNGRLRLMWNDLEKPLHDRTPHRYAIWNDLFHPDVPDEFRLRALEVIERAHWHTFLCCTKRPDLMLGFFMGSSGAGLDAPFLPNLWVGTTVEMDKYVSRLSYLADVPAWCHFISFEPLLGLVDMRPLDWLLFDWAIVGGETGRGARPMHPDWVHRILHSITLGEQTLSPFFFKGWGDWKSIGGCYEERECPDEPGVVDGDWPLSEVEQYEGTGYETIILEASGAIPCWAHREEWRIDYQPHPSGHWMARTGRKEAGRTLDGRTWDQLPVTVLEARKTL